MHNTRINASSVAPRTAPAVTTTGNKDNINLFKVTHETKDGKVYEYRMFKRSMSNSMKHNFLVRNKIINDSYI